MVEQGLEGTGMGVLQEGSQAAWERCQGWGGSLSVWHHWSQAPLPLSPPLCPRLPPSPACLPGTQSCLCAHTGASLSFHYHPQHPMLLPYQAGPSFGDCSVLVGKRKRLFVVVCVFAFFLFFFFL